MEPGLVSIIMPTYNRAGIIGEAIASALAQSYKNIELIIVDDGSQDQTASVVESFRDERIIYHRYEVNQGGNHARNIALKIAHGEYICFLDSDNKWNGNYVERQLMNLKEKDADISFCKMALYDVHKKKLFEVPSADNPILRTDSLLDVYEVNRLLLKRNFIDLNTLCIKRKCLENNRGFNERIARLQDWEFLLRVFLSGKRKLAYLNEVFVHNYYQKDSVTFKRDLVAGFLYVFEKWLSLYRGYGLVSEQCQRIIQLSKDIENQIARQDAIAGLLRFLPMDVVAKAIEMEKLKINNLATASKLKCSCISFDGWYSIARVAQNKKLVIYAGKGLDNINFADIPRNFLKNICFIISEEAERMGTFYLGIPVVSKRSFKNVENNLFVVIMCGCDDGYESFLENLELLQGVDYIVKNEEKGNSCENIICIDDSKD